MTNLVDIVSSRVKAELLRLLFELAQPELHLRELVRRSGLSLTTMQQELRRLTRVGLVVAREDGNRVYYRANPDHPVHRDLCSLVLKTYGLAGVLEPALNTREYRHCLRVRICRAWRCRPRQRRGLHGHRLGGPASAGHLAVGHGGG